MFQNRPDIFIYSLRLRKVIVIKIKCPVEENIKKINCEKICHYGGLIKECIVNTTWRSGFPN